MKPFAVLSDIHGNLEALRGALTYLDKQGIDTIYCLGDVVGYGPNPNECVELIRKNCDVVLMGNHDYAAIGLANIDYFNEFARMATYWTMEQLTQENLEYLKTLSFTHQNNELMMVHASPTAPEHWYYVLSMQDAAMEMQSFKQPLCFIGHSHVPVIYSKKDFFRGRRFHFEPNQKYIVNVGSVGQPRDGNPDSCFIVYDPRNKSLEYVRLQYDVQETYKKIVQTDLPLFLAERLLKGH